MSEIQTLIDRYDTGLAVMIYYHRHQCLPPELSLSFAEWKGIWLNSHDDQLGQLAFAKMMEAPASLSELRNAYRLAVATRSGLEKPILTRIVEASNTLEELEDAYYAAVLAESDLEQQSALTKIGKLDLSSAEWASFVYASEFDDLEELAFTKVCETASTITWLLYIYENPPEGSEPDQSVLAKIEEFNLSLDEWKEIAEVSGGVLNDLALKKMAKLETA
ncbi:MAG: hypothetical protein WC805_03250 [Patescibacteria group bacterium]